MTPLWSPVEREAYRREVAARLAATMIALPSPPLPGEGPDAFSTRIARTVCLNATNIAEGLCLALEGKL